MSSYKSAAVANRAHARPKFPDQPDPSSFANVHAVSTARLHLNLTVDFEQQILHGEAIHTFQIDDSSVNEIVLDTSNLNIDAIHYYPDDLRDSESSVHCQFRLANPHPAFGSALHITLPDSAKNVSTAIIGIKYSTTRESTGLQWLAPVQTAGKQYPYLFSQFQAIHARSAVPVQDSPSNKFTYTASITVPKPLIALMSAPNLTEKPVSESGDTHTFHFSQPVPIPSYLLALAVGLVERHALSHRCGVWSEAAMVGAGAFEFSETETFVATAEQIAGPYVWSTYDLLLLPPSFPYGGMENPNLTFVTPTLLAGDRSLAGVVAHEIAHSWSGNLTTSHNWEHFWLNEGFTVFLERKILQSMKGKPVAELDSIIGWRSLEDAVNRYGASHPFTVLNVKLTDVDPDDAFSTVPYEKGFNLLHALQLVVGSEQRMDEFLKAYFANFSFTTVTTDEFKSYFLQFFSDVSAVKTFEWDQWLHQPGLPAEPQFDRSLMEEAEMLATKWCSDNQSMSALPADQHTKIDGWSTDQVVVFLQKLRHHQQSLSDPRSITPILEALDSVYHFTQSRNSEIRFEWLELVIHAQFAPLFPAVMKLVTEQGRMKFVRPLYRDLYQHGGEAGKRLAVETFSQHRAQYHAICSKMVAKDLGLA